MAHKKGQGSSRNGRDSNAKRLGLKVGNGQTILAGSIILKQRGTKVHPGSNVKRANDDSLFACLLYTSPSPRDMRRSRMPSSA